MGESGCVLFPLCGMGSLALPCCTPMWWGKYISDDEALRGGTDTYQT